MKKRYLSLVSAITSLITGITLLVLGLIFLMRVFMGKEYTPTVEENLWIIEVLQRVQKAGFNIFFSIMGIILTVILAIYRFMLTYFYFKMVGADDSFYKARIGEVIFYSVLAIVMAVVTGWFSFSGRGILPPETEPVMLILFILYCLLGALPIIEIVIIYIIKLISSKKVKDIPQKEEIIGELDDLAEKTATKLAPKSADKDENGEKN